MVQTKDTPRMVRPENKIKKKMGAGSNAREILSAENISKGQNIINSRKEDFIQWAQDDIAKLTAILLEIQQAEMTTEQLAAILQCAEQLRDRGGTFGFNLASQIAKSLVNYCSEIKSPSPQHAIVVSKHIEGLKTVFSHNVEGDGGMIGIELMKGLQQLTQKFATN